jgi:hypothetical protein
MTKEGDSMNRKCLCGLMLIALLALDKPAVSWGAVPSTTAIQGTLAGADGHPLTGMRIWRVRYFSASSGGSQLGSILGGTMTVTPTGRWSVSLIPPSAVLSPSGEVWYELAIDSAPTPDGQIDAADVFSQRVRVESTLYARTTSSLGLRLTAPTIFHVSTAGNDGSGDGSEENPWASPLHALQVLYQYDLNGHSATVQIADGTYRNSIQAYGPFRGQTKGATQITFRGNMTSPENVVISPPLDTGYCFSAAFGAAYALRGMKFHNIDGHYDTMAVGQFSTISIANVIFGYNNYLPTTAVNDVTVAFSGRLLIDGDYTVGASDMTFQVTASFPAGTTSLNVSNGSNIRYIMGVTGNQFAPGTYVTAVNGSVVSISQPTTAAGSNVTIKFTAGKQCHVDLGNGGTCHYNSNGIPGGIKVTLVGEPYYHSGWFFDNGLCSVNVQDVTFVNAFNANCVPFFIRGNSTLNTGGQGVPYVPGNRSVTKTANVSAGSNTITLSSASGISVGNAVNGYVSPTASFGAGATSITVSSANFIQTGNAVTGPGIAGGTLVTGVNGDNVSLSHPATSAQGGTTLWFKGTGVANGTYVMAVDSSGFTQGVTLSQPGVSSRNGLPLWFTGSIQTGGQCF